MSIERGDIVEARVLTNLDGQAVAVPDSGRLVHLQLRRQAGCPVCTTHLRSVATRLDEIHAAGIREVVVFHSSAEDLLQYQVALPFDVIPDPDRRIYDEFDVGRSWRSILSPQVLAPAFRGSLRQSPMRSIGRPGESHLGMPGDFLIDTDGTVLAAKRGKDAADQWSVDELLALAKQV